MDLIAINDFNLVARHGGFGRAARASGRPKATLSRRVAELESSLQIRLFERGANKLKLTEEGLALYERTGSLLTELDETVKEISSGAAQPKGRLRISAPLLFCQLAMGKLSAEFALKYPEVQLEITSEDRPVDMVEEGYDLVIRVNPREDEKLYGRMFLRDRLVVVASPALKRPPLRKTANTSNIAKQVIPAVVRTTAQQPLAWDFVSKGKAFHIDIKPVLHFSSMTMVYDAVRIGAGVAKLPISLVNNDIASGKLKHWGDVEGPEINLWALYPSRRLLNARVSAFLEHLKDAFPTGGPEELGAYLEKR